MCTTNAEMPLAPLSGSVTTITAYRSSVRRWRSGTLVPLSTHSSPSGRARVRIAAASLPASRSESAYDATASPPWPPYSSGMWIAPNPGEVSAAAASSVYRAFLSTSAAYGAISFSQRARITARSSLCSSASWKRSNCSALSALSRGHDCPSTVVAHRATTRSAARRVVAVTPGCLMRCCGGHRRQRPRSRS